MRNYEIWRSELISEIRTIADASQLKSLWSGADPRSVSSFAEEVAHVFDDYDIDGFIAIGMDKGKLRLEQFNALIRFRDRFVAYLDELEPTPLVSINYERILSDPQWGDVTNAAGAFIALIDDLPG